MLPNKKLYFCFHTYELSAVEYILCIYNQYINIIYDKKISIYRYIYRYYIGILWFWDGAAHILVIYVKIYTENYIYI